MMDYLPMLLGDIGLYGGLFLAVMMLVIFVHEMGHYLMARYMEVRPELFSIGFGRELWGRTDRHGTRWSLRLVPFGGYVRLYGETSSPELLAAPEDDLKHAFFNKPLRHRALIVAAGPAMNFVFSLLFLSLVYMGLGRPSPQPFTAAVEVGSPAYQSGIQIGDLIRSIDGVEVTRVEDAKNLVADKIGQQVTVIVDRQGKKMSFTVAPKKLEEKNSYGYPTSRGYLGMLWPNYGLDIREIHRVDGVDTENNPDLARHLLLLNKHKDIVINFGRKKPADYLVRIRPELNQALKDPNHKDFNTLTLGRRPMEDMRRLPPGRAFAESAELIWDGINGTLGTFYQIIAGTKKTTELGGVIKISKTTGEMFESSLYAFLSFVALLSVSIGLVNLLPIPMLDGGHLLFYLLEAVKGGPVSLATRGYIYGFGLIFLLLTIFVINVNDLLQVLKVSR
jgi:regulator of sigma E protease